MKNLNEKASILITLGVERYEKPSVQVYDLVTEGVMAASGDDPEDVTSENFDPYEDDTDEDW